MPAAQSSGMEISPVKRTAATLTAWTLAVGLASAQTTTNGSTRALEERLEQLEAQIKILARQIELEKEQAAERAKTTPQPAAGRSGFSVQSADGQFRLRLRGLVHSDARFYLQDTDVRGVDSFLLRRVRPTVDATMYGIFDFRVMPDFGGGTTVLQDAYMEARLHPALKVRAGKFKAPVGFERLASASEMTFIERALPTTLVPNRDVGVMVHGDLYGGNLSYAAGVFNGVVDGGSADADIQDGKDASGRIFVQPFRAQRDSSLQGLGVGVSGSYGIQRGISAANSGLPILRTSGQAAYFAYRGDDPIAGPALADGAHARVSAHGHYYYGSIGLLAEHVLSSQKVRRGSSSATLDNTSWQVAGSWVVTGETPSYRGVTPRTPFEYKAGSWGALELTARYTTLDIDDDTFPFYANPAAAAAGADAWLAGINWYLNGGVKLQANFERTTFGTAGGVERRPENALLTRLQVAF
jgi:phosphate-selective porin OprO/OprP